MLMGDFTDNEITNTVIGCAIEVHRVLGPGLLESVYEAALCVELGLVQRHFARQVSIPLVYKGVSLADHRVDLVVERRVVVEVKSVTRLEPVHVAQIMTYLRILDLRIGLIINFNGAVLRQGIKRVMV